MLNRATAGLHERIYPRDGLSPGGIVEQICRSLFRFRVTIAARFTGFATGSTTTLRAEADIAPISLPLLAPGERPLAGRANFLGQLCLYARTF